MSRYKYRHKYIRNLILTLPASISVIILILMQMDYHWITYSNTLNTFHPFTPNNATLIYQMHESHQSIDINEQIKRINDSYQAIFGPVITFKLTQKLKEYVSSETDVNPKCIILTSLSIRGKRKKYDFSKMRYSYLSKYLYSEYHSYIFIIDTIDYLQRLNISRWQYWESLTVQQLSNISLFYGKILDYTQPNIFGVDAFGDKQYSKYFNNKTRRYNIPISITNHWNKVLSQIYWSKYTNCMLQMDDDAFIGNYHLSINYWLNLNKNTSTFLVLPYDEYSLPIFSNYGYILYSENKSKLTNFLLSWWENRKIPFKYFEQDAMYNAILKYLTFVDDNFKNTYLKQGNGNNNKWKLCVNYCTNIAPIYHQCILGCYGMFNIHRAKVKEVINGEYILSVFWTPIIKTPLSYILKHDSLNQYKYDIYPFSWQLNWGSGVFSTINFDVKQIKYRHEWNKIFVNESIEKIKMILDTSYIIHYRLGMNTNQRQMILQSAINSMEIFHINNKYINQMFL